MIPVPAETDLTPRERRLQRAGRLGFALNGATFLIGAWDGLDTHAALWTVALDALLGLGMLVTLARSRGGPLPTRLPYVLGAVGMLASALAILHHKTGLPYAYLVTAGVNATIAILGPERVRRFVRRRPEATTYRSAE